MEWIEVTKLMHTSSVAALTMLLRKPCELLVPHVPYLNAAVF